MDLSHLNPPQREAVLHDSGPLLVLAGAGSGKTRVITYKIARYVFDLNVSPHRIMALTFTNKAAREMKGRIEKLIGGQVRGLWIGTFHSVCARILRSEKIYGGNFVIYDVDDQKKLIKKILEQMGLSDNRRYSPGEVQGRISGLKNKMITPEMFERHINNSFDDQFGKIYLAYEEELRRSNAFDFDDLILKTAALLARDAVIREKYQNAVQYLLVDEYQDTNLAQYEVLKSLSALHRNITVVGDDDQSIYSWRGADLRNILEFEKSFPDAKVVRLEQNYRSTKTILAAANTVIKNNKGRKDKTLFTELEKGERIDMFRVEDEKEEAREILRLLRAGTLKDTAIFYRTNAQSRPLEDALRNTGLPYIIVGGLKFYERMEIKDVLAYFRVIANPADSISLMRIINVPRRGIGDKTLDRLTAFADSRKETLSFALDCLEEIGDLSAREMTTLSGFRDLLRSLRKSREEETLLAFAGTVMAKTGYLAHWEESEEEEAGDRLENLSELINAVTEYIDRSDPATLDGFLEEVSLLTDIDDLKETDHDFVTLMTLHASKGLEFDRVFIAGLEDGLFPMIRDNDGENQMEEERRLFYVGLTRAKKSATLFHAVFRRRFGSAMACLPSPFLSELPEECIRKLDKTVQVRPEREERQAYRPAVKSAEVAPAAPRYEEYSQDEVVYRAGMRVVHPLWGQGTITGVSGFDDNMKATVKFDNTAEKKLFLKYAKLEPVY